MERDANYVAVGAFVLLVVALGIAFVLWYSDARDTSEVQQYEIYFGGTVNGLTEGSPVRYLGVDVGRVRQLSLDREMPGTVKAVVDVDTTAPVSGATRASLRLQNITGLLYVELRQEPGLDVAIARMGPGVHVGDHGGRDAAVRLGARGAERHGCKRLAQLSRRGLHDRAVERAGHVERRCASGAEALGHRLDALAGFDVARDHDLPGAVEVRAGAAPDRWKAGRRRGPPRIVADPRVSSRTRRCQQSARWRAHQNAGRSA